MLDSLLDALFPPVCLGCRGPGWPFCPSCSSAVPALLPPGCSRCGRPLEQATTGCRDCPPPDLAYARAPLAHRGPARRALLRLKFSADPSVASGLALLMAATLERAPPPRPPLDPVRVATSRRAGLPPVVVTWVPLGRARLGRRGFDQAEVLARHLGALTGLPVRRLLQRVRDGPPQARRAGRERRLAVRGAFAARQPVPSEVLLVDDVFTTGATAADCARALRVSGAPRVGLVAAARSLTGPLPACCYTGRGLESGSVVARGRRSWKSMPAAGETTHVRRLLVAEHGAV